MTESQRMKKISRSLEDKYDVVMAKEMGEAPIRTMERFGINKNTYYTFLKNANAIKETYLNGKLKGSAKRIRFTKLDDVDNELRGFLQKCLECRVPVSGETLLTKAQEIAEKLGHAEKPDINWINRWKKRHGVIHKTFHGEAASADTEAAVHFLETTLPMILSRYEPKDIFNADETGLLFKCLPGKTHAFKNSQCVGGKLSKERLTVLLAASMNGEKLTPLVIGKSANPRCFKGVSVFPEVVYRSQSKAWMSQDLFRQWIQAVDKTMEQQQRKICLLVDNCTAHPRIDGLHTIELIYLPPNTTSKIQPLDAGVIRALKAHYRRELAKRHLSEFENGCDLKVDILLALRLLDEAWKQISAQTIQNCFRHAGFKDGSATPTNESIGADEVDEPDEWNDLMEHGETAETFEDYTTIDENIAYRSEEASPVQLTDKDSDEEGDPTEEVQTPVPLKTPSKHQRALQKIRELQAILRSDAEFTEQISMADSLEASLLSIRPRGRRI